MRLCPICVAQTAMQKVKNSTNAVQTAPAFKGWKAGTGSLVGAGIGIVAGTVLTGGILTPFLLGGAGSILGGIYGSSKENNSDDLPDIGDDYTPDWHMRD